MPSRAEILTNATNLREQYSSHDNPNAFEEWKGKSHGASFSLTKPEGTYAVSDGIPSSLMLAIRGRKKGREEIERDFAEVFGKPSHTFYKENPRKPKILFWRTEEALERVKTVVKRE